MAYRITQTLLSAWLYQYRAQDKDAARADFLRVLQREPRKKTPAMLDGIAFEDLCYEAAEDWQRVMPKVPAKFFGGVTEISEIITGAEYQVKASRRVTIGGTDYLLYGILDALKAGTIFDIKYKSKRFQSLTLAGDYAESPQHPMYFRLVPEAREFRYLVSDGEDLYIETYRPEDCAPIDGTIREFAEYLRETGLWGLYTQKWPSRA